MAVRNGVAETVDFVWQAMPGARFVNVAESDEMVPGHMPGQRKDEMVDRWTIGEPSQQPDDEESGLEWALQGAGGQTYRPLVDFPGLFRTFADLDGSKESFGAFAARFGRLGMRYEEEEEAEHGYLWDGAIGHFAEEFAYWTREHRAVRGAVRLWDFMAAGVPQSAEWGLVTIVPDGPLAVRAQTSGGRSASAPTATQAVLALLASYVSEAMDARRVRPIVMSAPWRDSGVVLTYNVQTLIGAMWLQLAIALSEGHEYRKCANCGDAWLVSRNGREARNYCSERCRAALIRKAKEAEVGER